MLASDLTTVIDCESAEIQSGLVLASGDMSALGQDADTETTVMSVRWPTWISASYSANSTRNIVVGIVVIKTAQPVAEFLGDTWESVITNEDVLDFRMYGVHMEGGGAAYQSNDQSQNPEADRPWVLNVKRKLSTTENVVALASLTSFDAPAAAGQSVICHLNTPLLSVLLQRSMRRR